MTNVSIVDVPDSVDPSGYLRLAMSDDGKWGYTDKNHISFFRKAMKGTQTK
jgi:hypothetical protein